MKQTEVSRATLGRIPTYLQYLKDTAHSSENISATMLARQLGFGEVQVRKDLSAVSGAGRPKTGYNINALIAALENFLNDAGNTKVVLVGAGKLGCALLDYKGFAAYGLEILSAFDNAVQQPEYSKLGKPILPMEQFSEFCKAHQVKIGIITVPAEHAQQVCDQMVAAGIRAVWCFAPCKLHTPADVLVQYENMALSLAYLSKNI